MRTFLVTTLWALLGLTLAVSTGAQSQQPSNAPAPAPAAAPSPNSATPSTSAAAPASESDTPNAPGKPAPKKVWTNDDFGAHAANSASKKPKPAKPEAKPAKGKSGAYYRSQIQKLNSQIADLDTKIATYRAALNGEAQANAALQQYHMRAADWPAEIANLTQQKQDLLAKITAIEDQARHDGIEPGELR
ncbi:MAG TPA: hypothetical protein VEJ39_04170 [Candidatus Acidoferrales bacterium]|nr:hypothetical protein [Candidatus Acidoferrales bacterium]